MSGGGTTTALRARFLGDHALYAPDDSNVMPAANRKAAAVLSYLVLNAGKDVPRSDLVELCWPGRGKEQGQQSFRQVLRTVRGALDAICPDLLQADRTQLNLTDDPERLDCDFRTGTTELLFDHPLTLLDGLEKISPVFDDWIAEKRKCFLSEQVRLAERYIHDAGPDTSAALKAAEHILAIESYHEGAVRTAMRGYARSGELPRAIKLFQGLEAELAEQGFSVSPQTREVLAEIKPSMPINGVGANGVTHVAREGPPAVANSPLVALDLEAASGRAVALVNEDLAMRLSQVREFRTVSAENADGEYELGGHVSETRADLRLTVHLTARRNSERIWSFQKDVPFGETDFGLAEFVEQVVGAAVGEIERDQRQILPRTPDESWSAYQYYLHGKTAIIHALDANYLVEAEPQFEKAIELDPDFLPAYPALVASYNSARRHTSPGLDWEEGNKRAMALLRQLLMRDARFANAHVSKAWCLMRQRSFDLAEQALEEAVALRPYEPARFNAIGTAYVYLGDTDRAEQFYDMAERRMVHDLDYQVTDRGEMHFFRRDFETALKYLDIGEVSNPLQPKCFRCATLAQLGRLAEAREEAHEVIALFRERWAGPRPFSPRGALTWYLKGFTFRRQMDFDNLVEGLTKAGLIL